MTATPVSRRGILGGDALFASSAPFIAPASGCQPVFTLPHLALLCIYQNLVLHATPDAKILDVVIIS